LVSFTNDARHKFQEQYNINKKIRNYGVILLFIIIILISIILIFITRLTFAYEKRLIDAGKKIEQNLNFKNRIVGMISHEIRSPLNIISIFSRGIRNQVKDQGIQDSLKSIEFTTHSLSLLANQILDFSKSENKELELNKTTFNLKKELDGIFTSLSSFVENNNNILLVNNSITTDLLVHTDVVKIHQLFYNIVGNANKFTRKGEISISIETKKVKDKKLELLAEVKDNGMGINQEDLKLIFDSYHQGKISESLKNLGAGLGLNLCKEIVELFHGKIKVTSVPNVETAVNFNLILDLTEPKKSS
jgi:two-component system sensor histidine kinase BarA